MPVLSNIDQETESLLSHLRGLIQGEEEENTRLVDDFTVGMNYHDPSLYSFVDNDSPCNPVINNLVLLLLGVIPHTSKIYSDLLEKLLSTLSFEDVCLYIPEETILESSRNPVTQQFALGILMRRVRKERAAVDFVAGNDLVYLLIADLLQMNEANERRVELAESVHDLISALSAAGKEYLPVEKFKFLTKYKGDEILTQQKFRFFVLVLSAIACLDFSKQSWGNQLFPFKFSKVLAFGSSQTRGSSVVVLASVYESWIGKVPFAWIKEFISDLLEYVVSNFPNRLADDFTNEYVISYQRIFTVLLGSTGASLQFALEFLSRPDVDIVDKNEPTSYRFFSQVCLKRIPKKKDFFQSHFNDLDVKSGSQFAVGCITSLLQDEDFFRLLVEHKALTPENILGWQKEFIFQFLRIMATFDYSAQYLIKDLPYLVQTYLLAVDRTILDKVIWNDKRHTLRQLLLHRKIDLGVWKSGLSDCLYEMENGRRVANLEPQVDVVHETS